MLALRGSPARGAERRACNTAGRRYEGRANQRGLVSQITSVESGAWAQSPAAVEAVHLVLGLRVILLLGVGAHLMRRRVGPLHEAQRVIRRRLA